MKLKLEVKQSQVMQSRNRVPTHRLWVDPRGYLSPCETDELCVGWTGRESIAHAPLYEIMLVGMAPRLVIGTVVSSASMVPPVQFRCSWRVSKYQIEDQVEDERSRCGVN